MTTLINNNAADFVKLHDMLGNPLDADQLYGTVTVDANYRPCVVFGYLSKMQDDLVVLATVQQPVPAPTRKVATSADSLFPVVTAEPIALPIDWTLPLWDTDGRRVTACRPGSDGQWIVVFDGLSHQWQYYDDGKPNKNYNWMPSLTNINRNAVIADTQTYARFDAYEVSFWDRSGCRFTYHQLNKPRVLFLLAINQLYNARSDCEDNYVSLSKAAAAILKTINERYDCNITNDMFLFTERSITVAFGDERYNCSTSVRYIIDDHKDYEVNFDGEVADIIAGWTNSKPTVN